MRILDSGETSYDLKIHTDGKPFWLVLGQSHSEGWNAEILGQGSLGPPTLINGYANGWLVRPGHAGTLAVKLKFTPQDLVWWLMGLSVLAVVACLGVVFATRRRTAPDLAATPELVSPFVYGATGLATRTSVLAAVGAGVAAAFVSRPWIGLVVAVATFVAARTTRTRVVLTAGAPLTLALAKVADTPELGWLAVTLFAADLLLSHLWRNRPDALLTLLFKGEKRRTDT